MYTEIGNWCNWGWCEDIGFKDVSDILCIYIYTVIYIYIYIYVIYYKNIYIDTYMYIAQISQP